MSLTLQEIAKSLDISTATVSRALNGKPGVSRELREKVMQLAAEVGYTPNPAARNLATSRTDAVAVVIRRRFVGTDNPFYDRVMMGIEMELEKHGYHLVLTTIDEDQRDVLPPGLDTRRLDGMIVVGTELSGRAMTTLLALGLPTVLVGNTLDHLSVDAVTSRNREGGYAATKHLIEHGHTHIAFLGGPPDWSPVRDRRIGYVPSDVRGWLDARRHGRAVACVGRGSRGASHGMRNEPAD